MGILEVLFAPKTIGSSTMCYQWLLYEVDRPFWKSDLGHFGWPKITFECISRHFRTIRNFFFFFFFKMAAGGHFASLIWAILDDQKSLSIAFLAISDQYTTFYFIFFKWPLAGILEVLFAPKTIGSSTMCYQWLCQIWSWYVNLWHS